MIFLLLATLLISLATTSTAADQIILAWDPNTEPDLEGYVLYGKQESPGPPYDYIDTYPEVDLADPLNPSAVVADLESDVTYYFAVTAYDTADNESNYSDEVVFKITLKDTTPPAKVVNVKIELVGEGQLILTIIKEDE